MRFWPLLFGFMWGMALPLSDRLFPEIGPAILHSALACYFAVGAVIVWHRTRLHWLALSSVVVALTIAYTAAHPHPDRWIALDWLIYAGGMVAVLLLLFIQSRAAPPGLTHLRSSMSSGNVMDALLFRSVPDLRRQRRAGE